MKDIIGGGTLQSAGCSSTPYSSRNDDGSYSKSQHGYNPRSARISNVPLNPSLEISEEMDEEEDQQRLQSRTVVMQGGESNDGGGCGLESETLGGNGTQSSINNTNH